jgi:hypothetical protein
MQNTISEHDLVVVMPHGNPPFPSVTSWGLVIKSFPNLLLIRIGGEEYHLPPEQVLFVCHTDGSCLDPIKYIKRHIDKLLGIIIAGLSSKISAPEDIPEGTLVIVLRAQEDDDGNNGIIWGIVKKKMPSGRYNVIIAGRRNLILIKKIITVPPEWLIPTILPQKNVIKTTPKRSVIKNLDKLLIYIIILIHRRGAQELTLRAQKLVDLLASMLPNI